MSATTVSSTAPSSTAPSSTAPASTAPLAHAGSEPLHPLFVKLSGRRVLVVGGGNVALEKARALVGAGARVDVVSPAVLPAFRDLDARTIERRFDARDVDGAWLVIAAATPEVNREVKHAADARTTFVVAVDDPAAATAYGASTLVLSGITIALSSSGEAPALVALLRRAIEHVLPDDLDAWTAAAKDARARWKHDRVPLEKRRPLLLEALNTLYREAP
jgi:siroheme synthase-like protein